MEKNVVYIIIPRWKKLLNENEGQKQLPANVETFKILNELSNNEECFIWK